MSSDREERSCKCCFDWLKPTKKGDETEPLLHSKGNRPERGSYVNPLVDPVGHKDSPETKRHQPKNEEDSLVHPPQEAERNQTRDKGSTFLDAPQETKQNQTKDKGRSPLDAQETESNQTRDNGGRPVYTPQKAKQNQTTDEGRRPVDAQEIKSNQTRDNGGRPVYTPQKAEQNQTTDEGNNPPDTTTETNRQETRAVSGKPVDTKKKPEGEEEVDNAGPSKAASSAPKKTELIAFTKFNVTEIDSIFDDFKKTLNPFVENREKMEKAEEDFKKAVNSVQKISPKVSFAEYVEALKSKLKKNNIFIKIKNGVVVFGGEVGKTFDALVEVKSAIEDIIKAEEGLREMLPAIVLATEDGLKQSGNINVKKILKREFKSVWDAAKILRLKNAFSDNVKKMKQAPSMVREFYSEARDIIMELIDAFADKEEKERMSKEMPAEESKKGNKEKGKGKESKSKEKVDEMPDKESKNEGQKKETVKNENEDIDKNGKGQKENKRNEEEKNKMNDKDKKEFIKQLKVDKIGIPDIDSIFQDFVSAVNPFIQNREQLEAARESFVMTMKTITDFEVTKALKEYLKELKEKAKKGDIHIYVDMSDGEIKVKSITGVPPPKEYRDAAKMLTDIKKAANGLEKLEPDVQRKIEAVVRDIIRVKPENDIRKVLKFKELPKLPGKIIAFNDNRKKIQQAPAAIKEFIVYVKDLLADIAQFFSEDQEPEDKNSDDKKSDDKKSDDKNSDDKESDDKRSDDKESDGKKSEDKKSEEKKSDDKDCEETGPSEATERRNVEGSGTTTKASSEEHKSMDPNDEELSTSGAGFGKSDEEYEDARSGRSYSPSVQVAGLMKSDDEYVDAKTVLA